MMTRETGSMTLRRRTTLVLGINPRGARHLGRSFAPQTCMRQGPFWILTMMQSCASAAKLRAAGPFSLSASVPRLRPAPATSDRRPAVPVVDASSEPRAKVRNDPPGGSLACRTQGDAVQWLANGDKAPQRYEQLARQRDDHRLARANAVIGSTGAVPQCQCALLLKPQKPPGELDHAAADPGVAGSGEPLFASLPAALVRCAR